jgi:hypothetical protein
VFGAIGVIALALIAFVLSTQRAPAPHAGPPLLLTEIPTHSTTPTKTVRSSTAAPRTSSSARSSAATSSATSRPPTAANARPAPTVVVTRSTVAPPAVPAPPPNGPCRSAEPCVVTGAGDVASALTAYRRSSGQAAVPVIVTGAAQQCARTGGDGSSCGDPFAVAREPQPDGRAAVRDIAAGEGNFLLDPGVRALEIGWAYDPGSGQYVCALIARS